jgi:L-ectoine synthase
MIVRTIADVLGTSADVSGPGWNSRRLLLASDGMGYSLNDTIIKAGGHMTLEYKNHLEACYCVSGRGDIEDLATGAVHLIAPGTVYALDRHDRHTLRASADEDMRLICVFYPALRGTETHGPDGSYS